MSESFKNRSSGRPPEANGINASRNLLKGLLAGIAVGVVAGVFLGRGIGNEDKKPEDNKPVPCTATSDDKPSLAYGNLKKRIDEMNKIKKAASEWNTKNTGVCEMSDDEVLDEAKAICRETALEFAREVGITDENDIDEIASKCLQGYNIEGFTHSKSGDQLIKFSRPSTYTLNDAAVDDVENDYISLNEKINEDVISGEHRASGDDSLSPKEKELNKKMENGDYKGVVDSFDPQSVLDVARNDAEAYEFFSGLITIASKARDMILSDSTDNDIKIAIACNFPFKVQKYIESFPEDLFDRLIAVPEYMQFFDYLMEYFTEALPRLAGLEEVDSYECAKGLSGIVDECVQEKLGHNF